MALNDGYTRQDCSLWGFFHTKATKQQLHPVSGRHCTCCLFYNIPALCGRSVCAAAKPGGRIRCQYFPAVDKVLFVDDYAVGCRKDLNGILLLDTALQPPVAKPEDVVQLELPVTEVREEGEHGECSLLSDKVTREGCSPFAVSWCIQGKLRKGENDGSCADRSIICPLCCRHQRHKAALVLTLKASVHEKKLLLMWFQHDKVSVAVCFGLLLDVKSSM